MAENITTPLWLDIKTEYIDQNFEKVVKYLVQGAKRPATRDSFFVMTAQLLEQRVEQLTNSIISVPLQEDLLDRINAILTCRMCGLYLLTYADITAELKRKAYSVMLHVLSILSPNCAEDLSEIAVANMLGRVNGKLPF